MRFVYPFTLGSETRLRRLRPEGVAAFAPLLMVVWFAYWVGMVSQTCCLPLLTDAHHSSRTDDHGTHHDGVLATHEPVAPMDHGHCPQLKSAELVSASTEALMESAPKPVLIALISLATPLSNFSTSTSPTFYQQSHPPPNRYLRTRRLLI